MKFFFPDSLDLVDPTFDFVTEKRSQDRVRQRDEQYPHEVFRSPPYDGILVSKAIVDGVAGGGSSRYSPGQRNRLLRTGVRDFFRLNDSDIETMGDCGAFGYINEPKPPFTVDEVIDFYVESGFDYGVSVDHVIPAFNAGYDSGNLPGVDPVPPEWRERLDVTLELAAEFWKAHKARRCKFTPVGVAQGWSPKSYQGAVKKLQKIGYQRIAIGGLVPLKTSEIVLSVKAVGAVRRSKTQFHLFGVTRLDEVKSFQSFGVTSFDSTSPLRQAFKDDKHNYYTPGGSYPAIRVPQTDGNPRLQRLIKSGKVDQTKAQRLEDKCLKLLNQFDRGGVSVERIATELDKYDELCEAPDRSETNRRVLEDRPWQKCRCAICKRLGIHVILFRGAERNRRRGFHNLFTTYRRLGRRLARAGASE